jgi:hypothetical protein
MSGSLVPTRTDAVEPPARKSRQRVPRKLHAYFIVSTPVFTAFVLASFNRSYIHAALERADII